MHDVLQTYDVERLSRISRINVVGTSGSGKSTLGRKLAESLQLPFFELDRVYWRPNWQGAPDEEFFPEVQQITDQSRWVLDGNYTRTTPIKWRQVQLVVWLDLSFPRTLFRVTSRCIRRLRDGRELWPHTGNRETIRGTFFSTDSVILWVIRTYHGIRRRNLDAMAAPEYSHIWFVRLSTTLECDAFLETAREAGRLRSF